MEHHEVDYPDIKPGYQDIKDILESDLESSFNWYEYQQDLISPTVLDSEYIKNYEQLSLMLMMGRLRAATEVHPLPDMVLRNVVMEIENEHRMRVEENAIRMSRLVEALLEFPYLPDELANTIKDARVGKASPYQVAELLSLFPELDGIEVMKATYPLDNQTMQQADCIFSHTLTTSFNSKPEALALLDEASYTPRTVSYSGVHIVRVYKQREAIIELNGVEMELIARRSYVMQHLGDNQNSMVAMSKYLRLSKDS